MRQNDRGQYFAVDTFIEAESKEAVKKSIEESKPSWIKDKNYRIKEIEDNYGMA